VKYNHLPFLGWFEKNLLLNFILKLLEMMTNFTKLFEYKNILAILFTFGNYLATLKKRSF
jgi:hypothetical protein